MTTSSEHTPETQRRRNQWIGAVALLALAALILPWLLTPEFEGIERRGPDLRPIQDAPVVLNPPAIREPITAPFAEQQAALQAGLNAPIGGVLASHVIQLGAFKDRANAESLQTRVDALDLGRVYVRSEEDVHRVLMGPWVDQTAAQTVATEVAKALSLTPLLQRFDVRMHGPQ
jgi:cell division septation protein DedD